jgi:hypothetical protein
MQSADVFREHHRSLDALCRAQEGREAGVMVVGEGNCHALVHALNCLRNSKESLKLMSKLYYMIPYFSEFSTIFIPSFRQESVPASIPILQPKGVLSGANRPSALCENTRSCPFPSPKLITPVLHSSSHNSFPQM